MSEQKYVQLSVRVRNLMSRLGFVALEDFTAMSEQDLLCEKDVGRTTVGEVPVFRDPAPPPARANQVETKE